MATDTDTDKKFEYEERIQPSTLADTQRLVEGTTGAGRFSQDNKYFDKLDGYPLLSAGAWLRLRSEKDRKGNETREIELKIPCAEMSENGKSFFKELKWSVPEQREEMKRKLFLVGAEEITDDVLALYGYTPFIHFKTGRDVYRINGDPTFTICVDRTEGVETRLDKQVFHWEVVEIEKMVSDEREKPMARRMVEDFLLQKSKAGVSFLPVKEGKAVAYLKFYQPELYQLYQKFLA